LEWTEETIRFFEDAADMTDYYEIIARRIAENLPKDAQICDAGCGLGYLSLALAPYCTHITAIDTSKAAVAAFAKRVAKSKNISVLCGDVAKRPPASRYDAMVFCLFGDMEQTLKIAAEQCRGKVFLIKRDYDHHRFSAGKESLGIYTAAYSEKILQEKNIPYEEERFSASFGQPFRSLDDAQRFFALYNRSDKVSFSEEEVRRKLTTGKSEEFPLFLPNERRLCLLSFDARDIPKER